MKQHNKVQYELCSTPCNLCGGSEISVLTNRSRSGKPLRIVICTRCGLAWANPLPYNPRDFYKDNYRLKYKGSHIPKPKHIFRAGNVAVSRYSKIEHLLSKPMNVLDVGSGGGEFAYLLKVLGHNVKGLEPNEGYAEYSIREYGLDVEVGFIQDIKCKEESFDLITMWHVLEHTEDPHKVLLKLRTLLKPQGFLVIEVPNVEATCQSPKSTFHEAHIFYFNLATLQKLVEKSGFATITHHVSDDGGNIMIITQKKLENSTINRIIGIPGNFEKITKIVQGHTFLKHYTTFSPYIRLIRRVYQYISEKRGVANFVSGKQLLDQLYLPLGKSHSNFVPLHQFQKPLN